MAISRAGRGENICKHTPGSTEDKTSSTPPLDRVGFASGKISGSSEDLTNVLVFSRSLFYLDRVCRLPLIALVLLNNDRL